MSTAVRRSRHRLPGAHRVRAPPRPAAARVPQRLRQTRPNSRSVGRGGGGGVQRRPHRGQQRDSVRLFPAACCAAAGGAAKPQGRHRRGWKSRAPETSQTRRAQPHRWRAAPREAQTALRHRPGSVYRAGERVRAPHALTLLCGPRRVQCSLAGRGWRPAACEGAAKPAGGDRTLAQRTAPRL